MSGEAIGWAFRKVEMDDPTAKFVLVAICNYVNDDDEAWPSHASIARLTGLSRRTIQTSIQKLEDWGLIKRVRRTRVDGSETSAMVKIDIESRWTVSKGVATAAIGVQQQVPEGIATDAPLERTLKPQPETTEAELPLGSAPVKKLPKKRQTIPPQYPMTNRHKEYAAERGLANGHAELIFENFRNHHAAKGTLMLDWDAAWRTWVGNEIKFSAGRAPPRAQQPGYGDDWG